MSNAFEQFVNAQENRGCTALHLAVDNSRPECVATLLEFKAKTEILNNDSKTALVMACEKGNADIIEKLVAAGADCDASAGGVSCLELLIKGYKTSAALDALFRGELTVTTTAFEALLAKHKLTDAQRAEAMNVFHARLEERAKIVSQGIKKAVPLPAHRDHKAPLDIVSAYTGFTIKLPRKNAEEQ